MKPARLAAVLKFATLPSFKPAPHYPPRVPPATDAEIDLWLLAVPHMNPSSPRREWYVRCWQVHYKIHCAKAAGRWPPVA